MVETVLTIKKTVNNLFGVNPFFGPNLTILYLQNTPKGAVRSLHHSAPQGLPPCSTRVMDSRCVHSASPITVSARTCQQLQVPPWSWILRTRRVESRKSNLRVAWRGSQRVNYMCMLCCMYNVYCKIVVELWVEVGLNK